MRKLQWALIGGCVAWAGCAGPGWALGDGYHPVPMEQGVNGLQYEADRQACETRIKHSPTNYELNDVIRFRRCLVDKGYRLLS